MPAAVAPPSGLVSWWTGDNTAADLLGRNNATLLNGTTYAAGQVGQALRFDGVDDRALLADSDSLKFTASMSIEAWIQVNAVTTTTNFNTIPNVPAASLPCTPRRRSSAGRALHS